MQSPTDLEKRVGEIGREIFSHVGEEVPSLFDRKRWTGKLMDWAMGDEQVKVQLFRLVDVLPALKSDDLVIRLLHEYFSEGASTPLLQGIGLVAGTGFLPSLAGKVIRSNVEQLARQFVGGPDPEGTLSALEALRSEELAITVDLLGEVVLSEREASLSRDRYLHLFRFLSPKFAQWDEVPILDRDEIGPLPRLDVSIKISSFSSQLDSMNWEGSIGMATAAVRPVIEAAQEVGASVTFDMEHYDIKDLIIAIFMDTFEENDEFGFPGIALQAYSREAEQDLHQIIKWAKRNARRVAVRLTKGAYWDHEIAVRRQRGWPIPLFLQKAETDLHFELLTDVLCENMSHVRPAFATHNVRSISYAAAQAEQHGIPKEAIEFQMIYGMAEPIRRALQRMGYRVRIYTPIGELLPGMGYLIRRLLENTSNESFLRQSFTGDSSPDDLTARPQPVIDSPREPSPPDQFPNEPLIDFSRAYHRARMKQALVRVRTRLGQKLPLIIDGRKVWTEAKIQSVNPARPREVIGTQSSANRGHVDKAVEGARRSWAQWRRTSAEERASYLFAAADEMRRNRFELAALEIYEVGKTWRDADGDVAEAIDFLVYYGREMVRLGARRRLGCYPGEDNLYVYEPKGVGAVISPWNFPLAISTGMVAAGIVTGNCVLFKPSSLSPVIAWKLVEIFQQGGLPAGVLQYIPGPGDEVGDYLAGHPGLDFIAFTGSKEVGLRILKSAAEVHPGQRNVKRVIAEMGGKNAIIVDETADLDEAVKGVVESAVGFQGQKCSACSRVIVVGAVFDDFCRRLHDAMESLPIGPPEDPLNVMGPLIDASAVTRVSAYVEAARAAGKILLERNDDGPGFAVGPVVFVDVDPDSAIAQEEIFGPVVAVMRARTFEEALDLVNRTPYALTGGVFSRSPSAIRKAQQDFRVGNLYINRKITGALVGRQPFGGFGMSGVGSKAGGPDYLLQFLHARSISENTLRRGFAPPVPHQS